MAPVSEDLRLPSEILADRLQEGRVSGYVTRSGRRVSSYVRGAPGWKTFSRAANANARMYDANPKAHRRLRRGYSALALAALAYGGHRLARSERNHIADVIRARTVAILRSQGVRDAGRAVPHRWETPAMHRARIKATRAFWSGPEG